jgi:uncharacterized protein DUF3617
VTATLCGPAISADLPKRKPGLWEITLGPGDNKRPSRTARYCIDAATESLLNGFAGSMTQKGCSRNEVHAEGTRFVVDSVCTVDKSQVTGHAVITPTGDTSFHMEIHSHFEPPLYGPADVEMTQDSKWLGSCPAGMQPGDMITATGVNVNLRNVVKQAP